MFACFVLFVPQVKDVLEVCLRLGVRICKDHMLAMKQAMVQAQGCAESQVGLAGSVEPRSHDEEVLEVIGRVA